MKNRTLLSFMKQRAASRLGRLVALTGARQTGKTTLVQTGFPGYSYVSLDDPITRPDFTALSAAQWYQQYPNVILDEVQKAPALIESVKMNELAQLAGVTSKTVKRFISYLEISYQVILLQPWFRNLNKRLSKAPKVHFLDPGIQRVLLNRRGQPTGHEWDGHSARNAPKPKAPRLITGGLFYFL